MPFINNRCDSCAKLHAIGKLETYERLWVEEQLSIKDLHEMIIQRERPENVPSYDSLKRHFQNHVKARFEAQADDYARDTMMKRMRESASVVDEIMKNLQASRDLSNSTISILEGLLDKAKASGDLMGLREMTALINSVTKQIGEIRRTLEFVHKLKKELKLAPDTSKADAIRFAEVLDKTLSDEDLIKLRQALKEAGISEY